MSTLPNLIVGNETLTQLVGMIMARETWYELFKNNKNGCSGKNTQEFLTNLDALLADNKLKGSLDGYWAQKFLVLCLARNMTVHSYPNEDSYYGDLFGPMLDTAIMAASYTWQFAKEKGWT